MMQWTRQLKQSLIPDASGGKHRKSASDPTTFIRRETDKPPTQRRIRQLYEHPRSFTNLLPWLEYDQQAKTFLLDDGFSVGALFELYPIGAEARPEAYMVELRDKLQLVISEAIPEEMDSPWVLQLYLQDEAELTHVAESIEAYVHPRAQGSQFTQAYCNGLRQHLKAISCTGGLFDDQLVTGGPWRGQVRRIRATLYRRRPAATHGYGATDETPEIELNDVAAKLATALNSAGVRVRRCTGEDLYTWLFRWFNPNPGTTDGDTEALLKLAPYPGDDELPFGYDFAEPLMLGMPHSDATGLWWFDGLPHKVVVVQGLRRIPKIGLFGAERKMGDHIFAVFDRMPENTVMAMTFTIQAQDDVRNHLAQIQRAAVGDYPEAKLAAIDAEKALMEMAKGNKLFPMQLAFYARGTDAADLHRKINSLNSLLLANSVQPIMERDDLTPLDSYLRNLPMNYQPEHDRREARRSRLMFSKHTANLMPLYGRSTGTGHPGVLFFNRGAEPLTFDPLNINDRKKNAHALIIGPTGAGKSALLVYLLMQMMAIYRPRLFIIEVGNSFGLLGQYFQSQGVSVNQVSLTPKADVSLPPFAEGLKLLDSYRKKKRALQAENLEGVIEQELETEARLDQQTESIAGDVMEDDPEEDLDDTDRDLLGEMEIAARIMITGGDVREDDRMTRADRLLIRHAILEAAKHVEADGRDQVLTEDVVRALRDLKDLTEHRRERAVEMADGMDLFCSGLAGKFFNRPGTRWPEVDVTITDIGILAKEGYEDQLTVAYIGLMNHIHDLVEHHQNDARPTLVVTDEGHIITTNPLLAPYVIKIVKMWRKLGAWFWIATQNLEDFPNQSRRMLNMLEWWLCLVMPKDEIEQIARFKDLDAEQRALLLAARKSSGQYTEGVVLTDALSALFRNVPPPLALALAMTEKDEKAERHRIMRESGCSELEAVHRVAETIAESRRSSSCE